MSTLLISDLHLSHPSGHSVLAYDTPRAALLAALGEVRRLVLLGDIVELRDIDPWAALATAAPVLGEIAAALAPGSEIIVVPGNHDRRMIQPWIAERGEALVVEDQVPCDATALLAAFTGALSGSGARVSVRYPGVRLSERVWATHGHYMDRLLRPEGPYGLGRRPHKHPILRSHPAGFERVDRPFRPERRLRAAYKRMLKPGASRLISRGLGAQMRHHSLPALRAVLGDLGVVSEYVVFGHVHRHGPLGREDWGSAPRFLNTGSWFYEPLLLSHARAPDPYWPGGAVLIGGDEVPRPVNLLEGLNRAQLLR